MLNTNDSIFKYEDWLNNHKEDPSYNYYVETTKKRKEILSAMGTPYFEEIRQRTKGIQDKLKKEGYEDIDLQLKSLFIDGIEFFLNLNTDKPQLNNKKWLYLKGLFDNLMINTGNKKLLNNILSELSIGGEKLPKSPIDFLVNYDYNKRNEQNELGKNPPKLKEEIITPKEDELNRIIQDFWGKDYGFIRSLRDTGVAEDRLEHIFLVGLYDSIVKLEKGETVDELTINILFKYYSIDISDKQLLLSLKDEIEKRFPEVVKDCLNEDKGIDDWDDYDDYSINIKGKEVFYDYSGSDKMRRVMYKNGDNYVPLDNSYAREIGTIDPNKDELDELDSYFDIVGSYNNGDRFTVVIPTYSEYIKYDRKYYKCWLINVRSQKTGKIYRASSH